MTVPEAFALALQHHQAGRLAEAEAIYRQILAVAPQHADALHNLGIVADHVGHHEAAVELIRQAIGLAPGAASYRSNLGEVYRKLGRLDDADAAYRHAIVLDPHFAEPHSNLANTLWNRGRFEEAVAECRRAIELKPAYAGAYNNLGNALRELGRTADAIAAYRQAIAFRPGFAEAHNNLGATLRDDSRFDEAIVEYRRALQLEPERAEPHNNLADALLDHGCIDDAVAAYRRAVSLAPGDAGTHGNLLFALHYDPACDPGLLREEHARWNAAHGRPLSRFIEPHANDRDPERRLVIGYVSPDFRGHVVGHNVMPLFEHHDHERFEVVCYSAVVRPDAMTERFRALAGKWRNIVGVPDRDAAAMIRRDGVDILVDLAQHTAGNRLPLFARQPAPVQVSFAGYPAGTGLATIEHRISDRHLESGGVAGIYGDHERVSFIDSFWCYPEPKIEVPVNSLPALQSGVVTFGCLNSFAKVNAQVVALWAKVLARVPRSRLVVLSAPGERRRWIADLLAESGIESARVEFVARQSAHAYLAIYHRIDIVLDTFPYNGHTTNLDALWMGVPVVSVAGVLPVSRAGLSQLNNVGLPELAAHTGEDYVKIAASLAGDLPRLAAMRAALRGKMERSVLMDAPRFARQIGDACREMWRAWCARPCSIPAP